MQTYKTIAEYMKGASKEHRIVLKILREHLNKLIPKGEEAIRYGMPTIRLNDKNFLHYAAMKGHLGFYPAPSGVLAFEKELQKSGIDYSKGCIRFPYNKPLPLPLITKIVKFRLAENKGEMKTKK